MHIAQRLSTLLLFTCLAVPVAAQQAEPPPTADPPPTPVVVDAPTKSLQDRVVFLLSGYEYFPTRADLDAAGSPVEIAALLRTMAVDIDARPSLRLRAVDALAHYDDQETVDLLTKLVTEEPAADLQRRKLRTAGLLRHHAITSLAKVRQQASVAILEQVTETGDVQLTLTVIHALGKHAGEEGREALNRLLAQSENKMVRREAAKWVQ